MPPHGLKKEMKLPDAAERAAEWASRNRSRSWSTVRIVDSGGGSWWLLLFAAAAATAVGGGGHGGHSKSRKSLLPRQQENQKGEIPSLSE